MRCSVATCAPRPPTLWRPVIECGQLHTCNCRCASIMSFLHPGAVQTRTLTQSIAPCCKHRFLRAHRGSTYSRVRCGLWPTARFRVPDGGWCQTSSFARKGHCRTFSKAAAAGVNVHVPQAPIAAQAPHDLMSLLEELDPADFSLQFHDMGRVHSF